MTINTISPAEAMEKMEAGAMLVDIRGRDEHARVRVPRARNVPLEQLSSDHLEGDTVLFHCKSGMRTKNSAAQLQACAGERDCYIVEGGLGAWEKAGLPVVKDKSAPMEMQRQVMIAAGLLVLVGTLLSLLVAPWFIYLAVFVGAGLTFAGVTGFCGMAMLLAKLPWNRTAHA
ncbi:MAG: DUF2892 domain-containing protein [Sphingomonas sp.]|nr:DUF2892 domain-containing protein [Sphingomonas sp.]RZV48241.1 MAG: DUF2892 domain-containing protein [Sphingomonadaceae bacterium]